MTHLPHKNICNILTIGKLHKNYTICIKKNIYFSLLNSYAYGMFYYRLVHSPLFTCCSGVEYESNLQVKIGPYWLKTPVWFESPDGERKCDSAYCNSLN